MKSNELQLFGDKVETWSGEIETWSAERIIAWAGDRFPGRLVLTCSFGGGGIVLAHMLRKHHPDVPVLFLDTGFHFPETLKFKEQFAARFDVPVVDIHPRLRVEEQATRYGPELYARNPDLCCALRKVEPLAEALLDRGTDAWMSALRRDQSPTRRHIRVLEEHVVANASGARSRPVLKIHPLAGWTRADVQRYIDEHNLPTHPLLNEGYTSIGCAPCTRPAAVGDTERGGRWAGTDKTECGLHTFTAPLPTEDDARRRT